MDHTIDDKIRVSRNISRNLWVSLLYQQACLIPVIALSIINNLWSHDNQQQVIGTWEIE